MADGDGRLTWLREPARFLAIFALFVVIDEVRGGDGTDSDFPVLLAEFLIAATIVELVVGVWRTTVGRGPTERRRPGVLAAALPVVLVGLPLLVGALVLWNSLSSGGWAPAVERTMTSPYPWILVAVYLNYALTWTLSKPRRPRHRPALFATANLALGLFSTGVVGSGVLPDRWYGAVAGTILAVAGGAGSANVAQQVFGQPAGPEAPAMPVEPSTDGARPTV